MYPVRSQDVTKSKISSGDGTNQRKYQCEDEKSRNRRVEKFVASERFVSQKLEKRINYFSWVPDCFSIHSNHLERFFSWVQNSFSLGSTLKVKKERKERIVITNDSFPASITVHCFSLSLSLSDTRIMERKKGNVIRTIIRREKEKSIPVKMRAVCMDVKRERERDREMGNWATLLQFHEDKTTERRKAEGVSE